MPDTPFRTAQRTPGRARALLALAGLITAAGCFDKVAPVDPSRPARLEAVRGDNQTGPPGQPLPDSLVVRVLDQGGSAMSGVPVRFETAVAGASVSPASTTTDDQGLARARWMLGTAEGEQTASAKVEGVAEPLSFRATARFGREAAITLVSGDGQTMPVGCAVAAPVVLRVTDAAGAPVAGASVYLAREGESTPAQVATTDAQGEAQVRWKVDAPGGSRVVASIRGRTPASVTFTANGARTAPNGFAAIGNRIVSARSCEVHRFVGVARPGLQWWPDDTRLADNAQAAADFNLIRSWGANVVRIPLYQRFWQRDMTYAGRTYRKEAYQALVDATVRNATAAGLDVILDLHASDRGDPAFPDTITEIQHMADVNHSVPFWRDLATRYKGNGRVIFQLYNEPNQITWEIWRNGGDIPASGPITKATCPIRGSVQSCGPAFRAAGYQQLYETVRAAGAENLVIINGMHWGYDLSQIERYAIDGYNIVYATHPYDYPDKQPDRWDADWGFVAKTYPLMIAEFGDYTCNRNGYYDKVLDYADRNGLSWVAWAWVAPSNQEAICGFPTLIEDWTGTPSPTGQVVKARLQSYRR